MWRSIILLALLPLGACAAAGGYPDAPVDESKQLEALQVYFTPAKFAEYQKLADAKARKAARNEILFGQLAAYNIKFSQFRIALGRDKKLPDLSADVAISVMGAVGSAVPVAATKTALLAAGSAVTGVKGAVDKDLFYDQALDSMFNQMSSNRTNVLSQIERGTVLEDADYPLTRGLMDVAAYRDAGSIAGATVGISTNAGVVKADAQNTITDAQLVKAKTPTVVPAGARPSDVVTSAPLQ
jgi:hypothetical protein